MSIGFLYCLKSDSDISIKPIFKRREKGFQVYPALTELLSPRVSTATFVLHSKTSFALDKLFMYFWLTNQKRDILLSI